MKAPSIPLALVLLLLIPVSSPAATYYVTPGTRIQDKIDLAVPGDTVVIFGGSYTEDIVLNKQINLQRVAGDTVVITGNVTVTGVTATAASPMAIANFKIGGDATKGILLYNCTNILINNVDASGAGLGGSNVFKLAVGNSTLGRFQMLAADVALTRVTVNGYVWLDNTPRTNYSLTLLQSSVTNDAVQVTNGRCRILYGQMRMSRLISVDSVIVGNRYSNRGRGINNVGGIYVRNGKTSIQNNEIELPDGGGDLRGGDGWVGSLWNNGVVILDTEAITANNFINSLASAAWEGEDDRNGVYVPSSARPVSITGNIFWGTRRAVYAPFNNVTYRSNDDVERINHAGGVVGENIISVNPQFVDLNARDYRLAAGSPCINAGPPDFWMNDRDGTRNDMGLFGGAAYDPAGKTTDKPIAFGLQATPLIVVKGVDTNVVIRGSGIVPVK